MRLPLCADYNSIIVVSLVPYSCVLERIWLAYIGWARCNVANVLFMPEFEFVSSLSYIRTFACMAFHLINAGEY
jgi:hypothetical protein